MSTFLDAWGASSAVLFLLCLTCWDREYSVPVNLVSMVMTAFVVGLPLAGIWVGFTSLPI